MSVVRKPGSFHVALRTHAEHQPDRVALIDPGRAPWTYAELASAVGTMTACLRASGVSPGERVALVTRNGAPAVACHLAITATNVVVPLNPAHRPDELDCYFEDLGVRAIVVDGAPEAERVARRRGLPVVPVASAVPATAARLDLAVAGGLDRPALVAQTSGTTSRPKIVPLTGANLFAACDQIRATLRLTPDDRCINVMPTFHIHGLSAVLATLIAGGSVVCPAEFVAPEFFDLVRAYAPTWYTAAPTPHQSVLEQARRQPQQPLRHSLRFVRSASSAMPPSLIRELEDVLGVPFVEAYGMTETAPLVATNPLPPGTRKLGSVGRPAGCEVAIMRDGMLVQAGETGEVVVRGPNVMHGYEDDPCANAEQFVDGWFRTGDLGRLDDDGYLFIVGRLKEIINRGGEKIAPPEVDRALLSHPGVAAALTFPVPHPKLGEEVAALVVLKPAHTASPRDLQDHVAARLADFKVPRHIELRATIPQEHALKPKRAVMAEQLGLTELFGPAEAPDHPAAPAPARTPEEEILAGIWEEVLGVERVAIHDDFFALGGDSVLAAQALTRGNDALGTDLSFIDFFENPTIALLSERRAQAGAATTNPPPVARAPDGAPLPLSVGQHALLVMQLLEPDDASNNVYRAIRMRGPLHERALAAGLSELAARHDSLRTTFPLVDGQPVRTVAQDLRVRLPVSDLSGMPDAKREAVAIALVEREARTPFDLATGPMVRARLVRVRDDDHILLLTMHHIMIDAWSTGILFAELEVLYEAHAHARPALLTPPALRYADYAYWQRQRLRGDVLDELTAYWKQRLAGSPARLALPFDFERPAVLQHAGARIDLAVAGEVAAAVKRLARAANATLFMVLLAAFKVLLLHDSNESDIVVGSPVSGRDRPELEGLVGYFSNSLVLRTQLDGDPTFRDVIGRVRTTVLEAQAHHELPFASVVAAAGEVRRMNQNPLFQVNFRLRNVPVAVPAIAGIDVESLDVHNGLAKFELAFELWESPGGLRGFAEFSTELFRRATVASMVDRFVALVGILAASPDARLSEARAQLRGVEP